jgi:alpha-tubulin suppressor-like RCC1 family protein
LTAVQVACGRFHSIALTSNGTAFTWGLNDFSQVGDGTTTNRLLPFQIYLTGLIYKKRIVQVAASARHSIFLAADGIPYGVGDCYYYQFGNCYPLVMSSVFVIAGLTGKKIVRVTAGTMTSHFLDSNGDLYGIGYNTNWPVSLNYDF